MISRINVPIDPQLDDLNDLAFAPVVFLPNLQVPLLLEPQKSDKSGFKGYLSLSLSYSQGIFGTLSSKYILGPVEMLSQ